MLKGEITAFLSLTFILLTSFILGVTEAAAIQAQKSKSRADTDAAVYSLFGEYQKELFQSYGIFGIEGSYGTGNLEEQNLIRRLNYYGTSGIRHEIEAIQYLTDNQGQAFREQALAVMEQETGVSEIKEITGQTRRWEEQEVAGEQALEKGEALLKDFREVLPDGKELTDLGSENPFIFVDEVEKSGILAMVLPEDYQLSGKQIRVEDQPSSRNRNTGRGTVPAKKNSDGMEEKLLLSRYMSERFQNALSEQEKNRSLSYEIEYLIFGKSSDRENLEKTVEKLFLIRMGANYTFLLTDQAKQEEAAAAALAITSLLAVPEAQEIAKQAILAAWAVGESIIDLRALLAGKKVALVKTQENWQLSLSGLMTLRSNSDVSEEEGSASGMSYEDYLRLLLCFKDSKELSMRALDRIEQNIIFEEKLSFFRVDYCVTKIKLRNQAQVGGNFTYEFPVYFGYL